MRRLAVLLTVLLLATLPAHAATVERVVSPKGIEAWLIQDHANPIIAIDFLFRGGAALDPVAKPGLATMVSGLLDEGAGDLDSLAFQTRIEDLSIGLGFDAGRDTFGGTLKTLTDNRDTAFDLLRLALTAPRFDADPVERIRAQFLAMLKRQAEDPDSVASEQWFQLMYPDHPYGRPADGTPEGIKAITRADLQTFVTDRFARDTLIVGVAGDITPAELGPVLDRVFGALPAKAKPFTLPPVTPKASGQVKVVAKGIPQSVGIFGHGGLKRDDPDWYAAYIVNYIMGGGGFASRLTTEVREKRGLAYSVYSYLYPYDQTGIIFGGVSTQNTRFKESLDVIRGEWRRLADNGPTADELANAKTYLTGSWPLQLDGTSKIAGVLVSMQKETLGIDYLDKRNAYLERVTLADARRVASRLYKPDALAVVVVGQPDIAGAAAPGVPMELPH